MRRFRFRGSPAHAVTHTAGGCRLQCGLRSIVRNALWCSSAGGLALGVFMCSSAGVGVRSLREFRYLWAAGTHSAMLARLCMSWEVESIGAGALVGVFLFCVMSECMDSSWVRRSLCQRAVYYIPNHLSGTCSTASSKEVIILSWITFLLGVMAMWVAEAKYPRCDLDPGSMGRCCCDCFINAVSRLPLLGGTGHISFISGWQEVTAYLVRYC